jgi:hypothetical protein
VPENKNQHFVPQFYLRFFRHSVSDKLVGTYHLPGGLFIDKAKIKDHACDDYFYGKDGLEAWLQKAESVARPILAGILATGKLPAWQSQEHKDLLSFVMVQKNRTAEAADEMDEVRRKTLEAIASEGRSDLPDPSLDAGAMAGFASTPHMLVHMAVNHVCAALDLRYKLILNDTGHPFITSDHPVAAYNQFYERNSSGFSDTGVQSRGLQLYFPLDPMHLLVFFDSDVYRVGGRAYDLAPVKATAADVEALNTLQVVNAGESLFFSNAADEGYDKRLVPGAQACMMPERTKAEKLPATQFGLPFGKVIAGRRADARINLSLSFIGRQPTADKYAYLVAGQRLRDPALVGRLWRSASSDRRRRLW